MFVSFGMIAGWHSSTVIDHLLHILGGFHTHKWRDLSNYKATVHATNKFLPAMHILYAFRFIGIDTETTVLLPIVFMWNQSGCDFICEDFLTINPWSAQLLEPYFRAVDTAC